MVFRARFTLVLVAGASFVGCRQPPSTLTPAPQAASERVERGPTSPTSPIGAATAPSPSESQAAASAPRRPPPGAFVALTDNVYGAYKFAPQAPELGELAPALAGTLATGAPFELAAALERERVMLIFYRGDW